LVKSHLTPRIPSYGELAPEGDTERLQWLRLIRTPSIGPITFFSLLERFGSAQDALAALPQLAARGGKLNFNETYSERDAEIEFRVHEENGACLLFFGDKNYPELLYEIPDPPPVLSVIGKTSLLAERIVSVIGARNASIYGKQIARKLASAIGCNGYVIASGFAKGIDTAAHESSLGTGTIAVMASGIDVIYPQENQALYEQIKEHGVIISESPLRTAPHATLFPKRNRLVAGMSLATVVIEAATKSGSLITARCALDYNREIFVTPGSPLDPRHYGSNQLIRGGATLVQTADDILEELRGVSKAHLHETRKKNPYGEPLSNRILSVQERQNFLNNLSFEPISIDELIQECHLSSSEVLTLLLELEVAGKVTRLSSHQVALKEELL
jgi:DNA processing protein